VPENGVEIVHSCPAWILGPRSAHPKFAANVPAFGGIAQVESRLAAIAEYFPGDLTSLHVCHEVKSNLYPELNSPDAIDQQALIEGIDTGCYPRVAAITAPAFGHVSLLDGALLSRDQLIVQRSIDLHLEAIDLARTLKDEGLGEGVVLWWPAFDAAPYPLPGGDAVSHDDVRRAWERLVDVWATILMDSDAVVHLEWKADDPGRDYINTMPRAIRFCKAVNTALGRTAMVVNLEWAHALCAGMPVATATQLMIEAGLFTGFVHLNDAELAWVVIDNDTGEIVEGTPGYDFDWAVGSNPKTASDCTRAMRLMLDSGHSQLILEHDINYGPSGGLPPLEYYRLSRSMAETMLEAAVALPSTD